MPRQDKQQTKVDLSSVLSALIPPLLLIVLVLGTIISGFATPTEAAGVGAIGALILALAKRALSRSQLMAAMVENCQDHVNGILNSHWRVGIFSGYFEVLVARN